MTKNKPLIVYSASAGSGKTFSLVQEYIGLTLGKRKGHDAFKHVIAMTFTNKAAWEMKSRIIEALDLLSNIDSLTDGKRKKATTIMELASQETGFSDEELKNNARQTLSGILHSYEEFHVMTIDKFSLRLIRTFNKDLELPEDFEVVLNETEIIEQVVDELLSKVGKPSNEKVTELTVKYAKTNLDEGNKWNFRKKLIEFGEVLTRETEQVFIHTLLEKHFENADYDRIVQNRKALVTRYEKQRDELRDYFLSLDSSVDDYPSRSKGIYSFYVGLETRTLEDRKELSGTVQKTLSGENVNNKHNVDVVLIEKTIAFLKFENEIADEYYFQKTLQRNFFDMALLKYLFVEFKHYKERNNVIGISEFGTMISKLLNKESALFIYERLGTRFHHYLLDEFQDTSRIQWMNLIPLVEDSIANGRRNLIVGDPKQAIYRFRDGLVEQFVSLPGIYNPESDPRIARISQQFEDLGEKKSLKSNYRSKKQVVEFNNMFFKALVEQLPTHFSEYYSDIAQEPKGGEGGCVHIEQYDSKEKGKYKDYISEFVVNKLRESLSDGYQPGDVCILVRNKGLGRQLARVLSSCEEQFKVISADSLAVEADKTVQFVMDYFNLRRNSANKTIQLQFATSFFRIKQQDPIVALEAYWIDGKIGRFDFNAFLEQHFGGEEQLFMGYENMFDLGQKFILLMELNMLKNPYLHHLIEILQQYDLRFGPDLRSFLEYWESTAHSENIQLPENDQAVKLMTIHKSKGLEFPVVIIPDLSWEIKPHREKRFFDVQDELLHVSLSHKNVPDYVLKSYIEEYEQIVLDYLNIIYVGFTRAENRIYALTEKAIKKGDRYSNLGQLLNEALPVLSGSLKMKEADGIFEYGEQIQIDRTEKAHQGFIPKELHDFLWFPDISLQDEELKENEVVSDDQRYGNQLHLLFSKATHIHEINSAISTLVKQDLIDKDFVQPIVKVVKEIMGLQAYQALVDNAIEVFNEQDILIDEVHVKRPDKIIRTRNGTIVMDFKTGKPLKKHEQQVRNYCQVLQQMGELNVEGYLIYANELEMKKVS